MTAVTLNWNMAADRTVGPTLYYSPGACSMASHIALEETGRPYTAVETLLAKNQHMTPEFLAVNPRGRVPALVAEGRVITENAAILTYIGLTYPETGMFPVDTVEQVRCISQMTWFSNTPHIFQKAKFRPYRFVEKKEMEEEVRRKAIADYWDSLVEIDQLIGDKPWMMGERYTVADPYALVFYNWGIGNGMAMTELRNYTRLKDQLLDRKAVQTVLEREKNQNLR